MAILKELCTMIVDCEHKTAPTQGIGYPSIRTPNIGKGRLLLDGVNRVSEETYRLWTQRETPKAGDLILAREAPIGNVAIIPPGLKVCLGQRTVLIRPNSQMVNPQYLTYLMLGDDIQGRIQSLSNGATVHHLNMSDIRTLEIPPLPIRKVQDRIASILSAYDDLIENNSHRIKILEEMAHMIYREWFVNFRFPGHEKIEMVESEIGPIPEVFRKESLGNVIVFENGKAGEHSNNDGPFPSYGSNGVIGRSTHAKYQDAVIIGRVGAYCGSTIYCRSGFWASDNTIVAKAAPTGNPCPEFIYFLLQNMNLRRYAGGSAQPLLTQNVLRQLCCVIPDEKTNLRFRGIVGPMLELIANLCCRIDKLRQTRDLLLPRLISGEISVDRVEAEVIAQGV